MTRGRVVTALFGGAALAFATPPALFPGAEFLVLAGLAAWFVLARDPGGSRWHTYLLGCVHMAWFSWSIHHVLLPAYVAIVVFGGAYFVLGTIAVRAVPQRWQVLAFGVFVAACFWLRANVPAIHYPHGQPCHALWQYPRLLASVTTGGEALANALLGWLAASLVELGTGWRLGVPAWPRAVRRVVIAAGGAVAATGVGIAVSWPPSPSFSADAGRGIEAALVEPGLHSFDYLRGLPRTYEQRLQQPTRQLLAGRDGAVPPLVLWPESSIPVSIDVADIASGAARLLADQFDLPDGRSARLLLGASVARDGRDTPAAVLVDPADGRILGHHEKLCLVPGGEFVPLLHWLPQSVVDWTRGLFERALGAMPDLEPGRPQPLLRTADGTPFGALLCYDNAFPGPSARQVAAGARFLCVLSNESWYRGGAELTQLVAQTVVRALETATPFVRCTTDGWTVAVGGDGYLRAQLPLASGPRDDARILRVRIPFGPGRLPPLAWLRASVGPAAALALGFALLHAAVRWARLRSARSSPSS